MTDVRVTRTPMSPTNVSPVIDPRVAPEADATDVVFDVRDASVDYGSHRAVEGITLEIASREITAIIGPSGCG